MNKKAGGIFRMDTNNIGIRLLWNIFNLRCNYSHHLRSNRNFIKNLRYRCFLFFNWNLSIFWIVDFLTMILNCHSYLLRNMCLHRRISNWKVGKDVILKEQSKEAKNIKLNHNLGNYQCQNGQEIQYHGQALQSPFHQHIWKHHSEQSSLSLGEQGRNID